MSRHDQGSATERNKTLGVISINPPSARRFSANLTKFSVRLAGTPVRGVKAGNCRTITAEINNVIKCEGKKNKKTGSVRITLTLWASSYCH